jgi:hypothetical protein
MIFTFCNLSKSIMLFLFQKTNYVLQIVFVIILVVRVVKYFFNRKSCLELELWCLDKWSKNCFLNHRAFFKRNWLIHYLLFRKLNISFELNEYDTQICFFDETYEIRVDDINCRWSDDREYYFCLVRKTLHEWSFMNELMIRRDYCTN